MTVALDLGSYSDISDFASLTDKIKLWLDRGSDLDVYVPTFISLAEGYLNRVLRVPEMENVTPVMAAQGFFTLPLDCLQVRGISASGRPLTGMSPGALAGTYSDFRAPARAFAISGRQVRTAPISDEQITLSYWQRIPGLTLSSPTNWLLSGHPDIYLYGALASAQGYIDAPDRLAQWTSAFEGTVQQLVEAGNKARWAGPIVARAGVAAIRGIRA